MKNLFWLYLGFVIAKIDSHYGLGISDQIDYALRELFA